MHATNDNSAITSARSVGGWKEQIARLDVVSTRDAPYPYFPYFRQEGFAPPNPPVTTPIACGAVHPDESLVDLRVVAIVGDLGIAEFTPDRPGTPVTKERGGTTMPCGTTAPAAIE